MDWQNQFVEMGIKYGSKVIAAILMFVVGRWLIRSIINRISKWSKVNLDKTLCSFIESVSKTTLYILLFITIGSTIGIKMSSFIAIFGAAGLAIGLALQGSLSNFAGGVLILNFRPFNVGDFIEVNGNMKGEVESIQILYTTLLTRDNKKIVIPNGNLANDTLINYSAENKRRVDLVFGIGYDDEIDKAKKLLGEIVREHDLIFADPEPLIRVGEHAGSSININCFVWCNTEDYWEVYYDLLEEVKLAFDRENINIPYPQMDVHMK